MRRATLLVTMVASVLALVAGVALADSISGGPGKNTLVGTNGADNISGGGSGDKIFGKGGPDRLFGDSGNDRVFGGNGRDKVYGGTETDKVFGGNRGDFLDIDDREGGDFASGGPGNDTCFIDSGDNTAPSCENVQIGT